MTTRQHSFRPTPLLLALALVAGLSLVPASADAQCTGVQVTSVEQGGGTPAGRFWASTTTDLTFTVLLPAGLTGDHLLHLDVLLPSGSLFRAIDVPVAPVGTGQSQASAGRVLHGYPHPVAEVVPVLSGQSPSQTLDAAVPFPLAGTTIVSNSLYGTWQLTVTMDDASAPCAATSFSLVSGPGIFADGFDVGSSVRWSGTAP